MLFKYKPSFSIEQFFSSGTMERKITFSLDLISLIKSKHTVLNKRSSSLKPKSVTFRDEEELMPQSNALATASMTSSHRGGAESGKHIGSKAGRIGHSSLQRQIPV